MAVAVKAMDTTSQHILLDIFTHKLTWKADSWLRSLWYIFMGAVSTSNMNLIHKAISERYAGKMR